MELFRYKRKVTMAEKRDGREEEKTEEKEKQGKREKTPKERDPMKGST